jgi:hypothetical protein
MSGMNTWALSIWKKKTVCGSGMSSGKMERYSVTGPVNDGRLTGAFHLTEIPEILLEIKWITLISGMMFL